MLIIFSQHALVKLEQRKIIRRFVLETVKNPELIRPSYSLRDELYKKFGKYYLKVVVKRYNNRIIVLTMHWVAKTKKKL